jgi:hypothetical protein
LRAFPEGCRDCVGRLQVTDSTGVQFDDPNALLGQIACDFGHSVTFRDTSLGGNLNLHGSELADL